MPEMSEYPPGAPCWVDTTSPDPTAQRRFYAGIFGWSYAIGPPETGPYALCLVDDLAVAGIGIAQEGVPTRAWNTYLAVSDADEACQAVEAAGGSVTVDPTDVMDQGRLALVAEPTGATFGLWEAGEHIGARRVAEHGAMVWHELVSPRPDESAEFMAHAFGYTYDVIETPHGTPYRVSKLDEQVVGGVMALTDAWPQGTTAHWLCYFMVDDTDEAVHGAMAAGGGVNITPFNTPYGRIALLSDPVGAVFGVIQPRTPEAA